MWLIILLIKFNKFALNNLILESLVDSTAVYRIFISTEDYEDSYFREY